MKKYLVHGTVSAKVIVVIEAEDDEKLTEAEMCKRATEKLGESCVLKDLDCIGVSGGVKFFGYSPVTD